MTVCPICSKPIVQDSEEHVIPNAIGGRKKVSGFICDPCNNKTGKTWDVALCSQFADLCLFFGIKRERGKVPAQIFDTVDGNKIRVLPDGGMEHTRPEIEIIESPDKAEIHISARNEKEAKKKIQEIVKSLLKRNPGLTPPDLSQFEWQEKIEYLDSPITITKSYGGLDAGKSIVKSALAMVSDSGINPNICEHAISFLREDAEACFGYYYSKRDIIQNRPIGVPFHCVYVENASGSPLIKAYIEFFGHVRYVLLLSSSYKGPCFSNSYCINPVTGKEMVLDINLDISEQDIYDSYEYKNYDSEVFNESMDAIMASLDESNSKRQQVKAIQSAIEYAIKKTQEKGIQEIVTPEDRNIFVGYFCEHIQPYLLKRISDTHNREH
ncbi:HNH endonuclease [Celerinatantimonas sp. MCCC 1A17872]|uniref:HNH endonuclease n=1 Tax=Celerinatantimonas sp. MCCC 1A17872 TaxID=3177514 RepID=UPI0038C95D5B